MTGGDERERAARLVEAEHQAELLFAEVTRRGLIAAGEREAQVSDRVRDLVDRDRRIGGFFEQLLTRPAAAVPA